MVRRSKNSRRPSRFRFSSKKTKYDNDRNSGFRNTSDKFRVKDKSRKFSLLAYKVIFKWSLQNTFHFKSLHLDTSQLAHIDYTCCQDSLLAPCFGDDEQVN